MTGEDTMLARLSIVLDAEDVDYHKSSLLQGVLLERLDSKYVNFLHHQQMHLSQRKTLPQIYSG
jgi:hypothetical protein